MLDLMDAIDARDAARVRGLAMHAKHEVLNEAVNRLADRMIDDPGKDWFATAKALLGSNNASQLDRMFFMAQSCRMGCVSGVRACAELGTSLEPDIGRHEMNLWSAQTPLTIAAAEDHVDLLSYLIAQGVGLDGYDLKGNTALLAAAKAGSMASFDLLLKSGANRWLKHARDGDAFHCLVGQLKGNPRMADGMAMCKKLIDAGFSMGGLFDENEKNSPSVRERLLSNRSTQELVPELDAYQAASDLQQSTMHDNVPSGKIPRL